MSSELRSYAVFFLSEKNMSNQKQTQSYAPSRHSIMTRVMAAFTASLFLASSQLALPAQANNLDRVVRGDMNRQEWRQFRQENRGNNGGVPTTLPHIAPISIPVIQAEPLNPAPILNIGTPGTINVIDQYNSGAVTVGSSTTSGGNVNASNGSAQTSAVTIFNSASMTAGNISIQNLPATSAVNVTGATLKANHRGGGNGGAGKHNQANNAAAKQIKQAAKADVRVNRVAEKTANRVEALSRFVTQENAGAIVKLDNGANLDLTTSSANITLGDKLFGNGGFVTIEVGGEKKNVYAGSKVTAAEYIAVKQVLNGKTQTLTVNASGIATGGTVDLSQVAATKNNMKADSLTVASGVTAVGDLDKHSTFKLSGDLNNFGSVIAVNSGNVKKGADITADNINNNAGALISSNAGSQFGNQQSSIDLSLNANQNLNNAGTIESSGDLTLTAGNSVQNSGSVKATNNINVLSNNITNSGTVASAAGNITVDTPVAAELNVNNNGGTLQALEGAINVRGANYAAAHDTNLVGGDLLSKQVNLQTGLGLTEVDVNKLTGVVNGTGTAAHVSANTDNLQIGTTCLTGDPVFKNSAGDITITGDISVGETLAILASGNISTTAGVSLIEARTGSGVGQDITIAAGFQVSGGGGGGTDNTNIPPGTPATGNTFVFNGGVAQGGDIDFTASTGLVIDASGTSGNGGDVSLYARGNNTNTLGNVRLGLDSTINTSGSGAGTANGDITVFAGSNAATTAISLGTLDSDGGAGSTGGNITVRNAQPSAGGGVTFDALGAIIAGNFTSAPATLTNPGIVIGNGALNSITAGGNININGGGGGTVIDLSNSGTLSSRGGDIAITSGDEGSTSIVTNDISTLGGDVSITAGGSVIVDAPFGISTSPAVGAGGNVLLRADTNSNNVGLVDASGVNIATSGSGAGAGGNVVVDVNLGVGLTQIVSVGDITTLGAAAAGGDISLRAGDDLFVGTILSNAGGDLNIQTSANNGDINLGGNVTAGTVTASVNGTGVINTPVTGIVFTTDGYTVTGPVNAAGQPVTIQTLTAATTIGVAGGTGTLNISSAELAAITASSLTIGDPLAGNITVGGNIDVSGAGPAGAYDLNFITGANFTSGTFDFILGTRDLDINAGNNITTDAITATTGDVSLNAGGDINTGFVQANTIQMGAAGNINLRGNLAAINSIDLAANAVVVPVFNVILSTSAAASSIDIVTSDASVPLTIGTAVQQLQISAPGAGSTVDLDIAGNINVTATGGFTTDNIEMTTTGAGSDIILNGNVTGNNSFVLVSNDQIQIGGTITGGNGLTGTAGGDIFGNGTVVSTDLTLTSTNGSIGTSAASRLHGQTTGTVLLNATNGSIFYDETGNLTLGSSSASAASGTMDIVTGSDLIFVAGSTYGGATQTYRATTGSIAIGANSTFNAINSVSLRSFNSIVNGTFGVGSIFNTPQTNLTSDAGNIGTDSVDRLNIDAVSLSVNAPLGNAWITVPDDIIIGGPNSSVFGTFDLLAVGGADITTSSAISSSDLLLTTTLGTITVNSVVTGVNTATLSSAIDILGTGSVSGNLVSLTATAGQIGASSASRFNVDADILTLTAGTDAYINDFDSVNLSTSNVTNILDVQAQDDLNVIAALTSQVIRLSSVNEDLTLGFNINGTTSVTLSALDTISQTGGTIVTPALTILDGNTTITSTNNAGAGQTIQVSSPLSVDADITTQETGTVTLLGSSGNNLTFNASQATDVTIAGNVTASDTLDITTSVLNNSFQLTSGNVINVQSPTGDLTIDGDGGTGSFSAPNGINLLATSGDLIFLGNTNFFGQANLFSNPNAPFGSIVISTGAVVIGDSAVNLNTCSLILNGILQGNPVNFLCPTGAGTIANTVGDVDLTALGDLNFVGQSLAIIASGDINLSGNMTIDLSDNSSGGTGGSLSIISGYNFTPATPGQLDFTPILFTATGESAGGSINLGGLTVNTSGDAAGGNVTAVAQNGTITLGTIDASSANGGGGSVNIVGENGVTVGNIRVDGPIADGSVNLAVSAPQIIAGPLRVGNGIIINGFLGDTSVNSAGNLVIAGINAGQFGIVTLVGAAGAGDSIVQSGVNPLDASFLNIEAGSGLVNIGNALIDVLNSNATGDVTVTVGNNFIVNNVQGATQDLTINAADGVTFANAFSINSLNVTSGVAGANDIVFNGAITTAFDLNATNNGLGGININAALTSTSDSIGLFTTTGSIDMDGPVNATVGSVIISSGDSLSIDAALTAGANISATAANNIGVNAAVTAGGTLLLTATSGTLNVQADVESTADSVNLSAGTTLTVAADVIGNQNADLVATTITVTSAGSVTGTNGEANLISSNILNLGGNVTAGTAASLLAQGAFVVTNNVVVTATTSAQLSSGSGVITGTAGVALTVDGGLLVTTAGTNIAIAGGIVDISADSANGIVSLAGVNVSGVAQGSQPTTPSLAGGNAGSITISANAGITTDYLRAYGGGGSGGDAFGAAGGDGGDGGNISVSSFNGLIDINGDVNTSGGGGGGQAFPNGAPGGGGDGGDAGTISISTLGSISIDGPVLAAGGAGGAGTSSAGGWTDALSSGGGSFGGGGGGGDGGPGGGGAFGGGGAGLLGSGGGGGGISGGGAQGGVAGNQGSAGLGGNGGFGGLGGSTGGNFGESGSDNTFFSTLVGEVSNGDLAGVNGSDGAVTITGASIGVTGNVGTQFPGTGFSNSAFSNQSVYGSTVALTSTAGVINIGGDVTGSTSVNALSAFDLTIQGNVRSLGATLDLVGTAGPVTVNGDIFSVGNVNVGSNGALLVQGDITGVLGSITLSGTSTIDVAGDISAFNAATVTGAGDVNAQGFVESLVSSVTISSATGSVDVAGYVNGGTAVNVSGNLAVTLLGNVASTISTVDLASTTGIVSVTGTITGASGVNIFSQPSFTTQGNITSTGADVDIITNVLNNTFVISGQNVSVTSQAGTGLTIDGSAASGGTLTATAGTVDLAVGTTGNVTFIGEQTFNGTTNIDPSMNQAVIISNGAVVTGNDTVNLNTCSLQLQGNGVITGNPLNFNCPNGAGTIANSSGDVDLGSLGPLVFNGQSLAIIASGSVFANGNTSIDLSAGGGADAGSLTVIAGYDFTPTTGGVQTTLPNPIVYTLTGPNATGGDIDLTGLVITTFANGGGAGGDVTLIANGGTAAAGGIVTGLINSSADTGTAGEVLIVGEGNIITAQIFAIDSTGGNITIAVAQPTTTGTITLANGELTGGGSFGIGAASDGLISTSNLNVSQLGGTGTVSLSGALSAVDTISVFNTLTGTLNITTGLGSAVIDNSDVVTLNVISDGSVALNSEIGAIALGSVTGTMPDLTVNATGAITTNGGDFNVDQLTLTGSSVNISVNVSTNGTANLTANTGDVVIALGGSLVGTGDKNLTALGPIGDVVLGGSLLGTNVALTTNGGDIIQTLAGAITADFLTLNLNSASSTAFLGVAANNVGNLSGTGDGAIQLDNSTNAIDLGTFSATQDISVSTTASIDTTAAITTSGDINLVTPIFNNTFAISAGNILIEDQTGAGLTIDGSAAAGGSLSAIGGVNLGSTAGNVTFIGEQTFGTDTFITPGGPGFGVIVSNGAVVTGLDDVTLNTCSLILQGTGTITANVLHFNCPLGAGTIANSSGDVDLTGLNLTFNGLSLAIIASGDVFTTGGTTLDLSRTTGSGDGGNLLVVAGFDFLDPTAGQVGPNDTVYTFTGSPSLTGGDIALSGVNITTNALGDGNGGNITLVAAAGTVNDGSIDIGNLTANGAGTGNGGDILVIAEGGFTTGTISNTGVVSGTTTLAAAIPTIINGPAIVGNGELIQGQFTSGAVTGSGTIANMTGDVDLSLLNLTFVGEDLAIIASGNVNAGSNTIINLSNPGGAGGDLLVVAGFDFSPSTGNSQVDFDSSTVFTFTGAGSATGGDINFAGLSINTNGNGGDAGDITLVAKGGGINDGAILVNSLSAVGSGGGNGGDILLIAEDGFNIGGTILNNGATNGTTTLAAAVPVITGTINVLDGTQGGGGSFTFATPTGAGTIANSAGDVNISGTIQFTGLSLAILASNNINASNGTVINLSDAGGIGGGLTMIAGFDFTPGTGGIQVNDNINVYTITGPNTAGGNINAAGLSINTTGLTAGGNIIAVANGGNVASGAVNIGGIDASSNGNAGTVTIIGEGGVTTGFITTTGATGGDVNLLVAQPIVSGTVTVQNGNLLSGTFVAGAFTNGLINVDGVDSGNSVTISANTGAGAGITVGNILADQDINITNTGSVTINADLTADLGEINVLASDVAGSATLLTINDGVQILANTEINLVNTGSDKKLDFLALGAGATIATFAKTLGQGDVNIRLGAVVDPANSNSLPKSKFTVTETGGGTFNLFGKKPKGSKPMNFINATGANVNLSNAFKAKNLTFGGGTTVTADPPVAAGSATYVNGRLVSGTETNESANTPDASGLAAALNLVQGSFDQVQANANNGNILSVTGIDATANVANSLTANAVVNGASGTGTAGNTTKTETLFGGVSAAIEGEDNSYMVSSSTGPIREADASICSDADLGTAGNATHLAHTDRVVLKQGNVLFVPFRNTVVETPQGNVTIEAKSVALVSVSNGKLAVYDLEDSHKGAVSIEAHGQKVTLAPGNHLTIAQAKSGEFAQVNAIEAIPHRNVATRALKNGVKFHSSEFSVVSAMHSIKPLQAVMGSKHPQAKKVADRMMKTTAVLLTLGGKGEFQHFFKPAITAMK